MKMTLNYSVEIHVQQIKHYKINFCVSSDALNSICNCIYTIYACVRLEQLLRATTVH